MKYTQISRKQFLQFRSKFKNISIDIPIYGCNTLKQLIMQGFSTKNERKFVSEVNRMTYGTVYFLFSIFNLLRPYNKSDLWCIFISKYENKSDLLWLSAIKWIVFKNNSV